MNTDLLMPDGRRFITIERFVEMLGMKSKQWFYDHKDDAHIPQRVYLGKKPYLLADECMAYLDHLVELRRPAGEPTRPAPKKANPPPPDRKRRTGRPVKPPARFRQAEADA
jgi:predicted DNA-binding transcriptional regulator AlpA